MKSVEKIHEDDIPKCAECGKWLRIDYENYPWPDLPTLCTNCGEKQQRRKERQRERELENLQHQGD